MTDQADTRALIEALRRITGGTAVTEATHAAADALEATLPTDDEREAEWTTEADITWPGDLHPRSRIRASRDLIREANSVRDLDGTGIVGRLADMLAGWLSVTEDVACEDHEPIQHRDAKPPWCKKCGLTATFEKPESRFTFTERSER